MNCLDCKLIKNTIIYGILTLFAVAFSYNFLDIKIVMLIHSSDFFGIKISTFSSLFSKLFSPSIWMLITIIVTATCIYKYIIKKPSSKLYTMSLALILTFFITGSLKVILARSRPELLIFDNQYGFNFFSFKSSLNSMPSGHTAFTFAGLLAIANFFNKKYLTLLAIFIGCLVAISRVIILDHYVSDVIIAAYIGIFTYLWSKSFVENQQA